MKLFKNVDVADLKSILEKGILPADEAGNNWDAEKRVDNATDVVYLFSPLKEQNSFTQYGVALLEVEVEDATENELAANDFNEGYTEYTVKSVSPEQIKNIYIPAFLKNNIVETADIDGIDINWCDFKANWYEDDKVECTEEVLAQFAKTAYVTSTKAFNYFRGMTTKNTMIDLYDCKYSI